MGQVVDRFGARITYGLGLSSLGLSYVLAGFSTTLWHYMVTVGLLGGLGAALLGMIVASALLSRWFTSRMGSVGSLPYAAIGAGMLVLPPMTQVLLQTYDWRTTHMILGSAVLLILPLVMLLPLGRMSRGSAEWRRLRREATDGSSQALDDRSRAPHKRLLGAVPRLLLNGGGLLQRHAALGSLSDRARFRPAGCRRRVRVCRHAIGFRNHRLRLAV